MSCQAMAAYDIRFVSDEFVKAPVGFFGFALKADEAEAGQRFTEFFRVQNRGVLLDYTLALKLADSFAYSRHRKVGAPAYLVQGLS